MAAWQIPTRESLLPISPEQSCAVCGSEDWSWLYFLLLAPDWVQRVGWFPNWFVVMCASCHRNWDADDRAALAADWRDRDRDSVPDLGDYLSVVKAMQSEPPRPRNEVTAR